MENSYCYSRDEEHFDGTYSTLEEALAAGRAEYPGATIWVGKIAPFEPDYNEAADSAFESLYNQAYDTCGEAAENWELEGAAGFENDLRSQLAAAIKSVIDKLAPPTNFWQVVDAKEFEPLTDEVQP